MSDDEHNSAMDTNDNSDSNENSVSKTMGICLSFFVCVTKQSEKKKFHGIDGVCEFNCLMFHSVRYM